jgi:uncharacterized protein
METTTPRMLSAKEIFHKLHDCVLHFDADGQAQLFDENGTWELPFASEPIPKKIIGREAIRNFGRMGMDSSRKQNRRLLRYNRIRIHETVQEDLIIVEFDLEGEVTTDGSSYVIPFIQVIQVKSGKIVLLRDYFASDLLRSPGHASK